MAAKRLSRAAKRARRHQKISDFNKQSALISAAGAKSAGLWGSGCMGISDSNLKQLTGHLVKPVIHLSPGQSASLTLQVKGWSMLLDPAYTLHAKTIVEWATGIWTGWPGFETMDFALENARRRLLEASSPWAVANDAASGFILTCTRLSWTIHSARVVASDTGIKLDFLKLAPKTIGLHVAQATQRWNASAAASGDTKLTVDWKPIRELIQMSLQGAWTA